MNRHPRLYALALAAALLLPAAPVRAQAPDSLPPVTRIAADPGRGFSSPYFLYVPPTLRADSMRGREHTILVIPNNTGVLNDDPAFHEERARMVISIYRRKAAQLGFVVLEPAFPRPESHGNLYTHALDRDALTTRVDGLRRLDLQLIAMVDDARRKLAAEGVRTEWQVLMHGHSAAGMFVSRFVLLHPERVKAATVVAPGGWPIAPVAAHRGRTLNYPAGIADVRALTGHAVDLRGAARVPLLFMLGTDDTNDSVPYDDSYDPAERAAVTELFGATPIARWPAAEVLYRGVLPRATFRTIAGAGHDITNEMWAEIWAFHRAHITH